ncbi:hypothetical protein DCAR_0311854 [Daucus carota subsp. sativus]|uniref:Uncharacterized protein n=1 Tax=Daucus carota subsp. sativus TaxID=79200 RepID=A0AAF1AU49_DAUCS|nr:hypothetical protein DCAR_0311844 [Daucus carota subsp. sativus]WOG92581.1 hypothetical protein DCAR_0311854 [Daucus carota subsp. sativus]
MYIINLYALQISICSNTFRVSQSRTRVSQDNRDPPLGVSNRAKIIFFIYFLDRAHWGTIYDPYGLTYVHKNTAPNSSQYGFLINYYAWSAMVLNHQRSILLQLLWYFVPLNYFIFPLFVLLGYVGTGKSSLVMPFVKGQFIEFQESRIGAAFFLQTVAVNEATVKFEIWDTAGQERYHSLAPMYYGGAAAAIVVKNWILLGDL